MKGALSWGLLEWGALVLIGLSALQTYRLLQEQRDHEVTRREMSDQIATQAKDARDASEQYRKKESQWARDLGKVASDARDEIDAARAAAGRAGAESERLRGDYARALTAYRRLATQPAAAAGAGPAADQAADLLANVQRRLDEAAGGIALFADESFAAGTACWRSSQALSD